MSSTKTRSIEELYRVHSRRCLAVALRVTHDQQLAEDAVQEAFLSHSADSCRFEKERGDMSGWLSTLTHRRAIDLMRREERQPGTDRSVVAYLSSLPADGPGPETQALVNDAGVQVRAGLAGLTFTQRQALYLSYYLGYSQSQVATATGAPIGTVKSRIRDGMAALRLVLT